MTDENKNILVDIPFEDWPKLRDLYANRKTESNSFNTIQNYINFVTQEPNQTLAKLYSLNGDWSDGTFIIQVKNSNPEYEIYIMFNTCANSQERLLAALNCLDKKPKYNFSGFPDRLRQTLETYISGLGLTKDDFFVNITIWHHIEIKKALEFDVTPPAGITLSRLRNEDVNTINDIWPHRHPGSDLFIDHLISYNPSIGAYEEDGNLVSWCLFLPCGSLGLLHVKDSHKRRGLGSLMVRVMSKTLAEQGIETIAPVVEENTPSRSMFLKLGFQEIDKVLWLHKPALK